MNPEVSIIIPTWNTCDITLKCIKTIEKYLPKDYAQIVIVDNGSTDDTEKVFSKLTNITYIRNSSNLGFSKANNIGIKKSTGKYFLFLNSDMELIDKTLVDLINYAKLHPEAGAFGPKFLNPDLTPQGSVTPPQTSLNAFKEFWLGHKSFTKYLPDSQIPVSVWAISGGAFLISRKDCEKVGGWDERYFFYFEDLEFCRQIHKLGKEVIYYPQCQVIHRHGASGTVIAAPADQWRRLIPSSLIYHGRFEHNLINLIIWSGQKFHQLFKI